MSSQTAPSPAKVIASRKSTKRPHRVTAHLSDAAMATLEQEMATIGYSDADALIERLLSEHVERRAREQKRREEGERIVTTESGRRLRVHQIRTLLPDFRVRPTKSEVSSIDEPAGMLISGSRELFRTAGSELSPVCEVSVREIRGTSVNARYLLVQNFYDDLDGTSRLVSQFTLGRTSIPWLIAALEEAEAAIEFESTRNRKNAQAARAARSTEEVTHYEEMRRAYTERYSKERVTRAITLAGRHSSRARNVSLKKHFSPWEWLDLCARNDFRCDSCGALTNLEPHHINDLCNGGPNTIDNIQPLCRCCHRGEQLELGELAELWLYQQQRLHQSFRVGDRVRRKDPKSRHGTIVELLEPSRSDGIPNLSMSPYAREKVVELWRPTPGWVKAKGLVSWPWGDSMRNSRIDLTDLVKVEDEK